MFLSVYKLIFHVTTNPHKVNNFILIMQNFISFKLFRIYKYKKSVTKIYEYP